MVTRVLFICHGNICRSPMAMFVMRDMVKKQGLERSFRIDSAATSREEIGNPCYPPARRKLAKEGLSGEGHAARKMVREDYENYDYLMRIFMICMPSAKEMIPTAEAGAGGTSHGNGLIFRFPGYMIL